MTIVAVTPANVRQDTTKGLVRGLSGAAILAGQLCYQDPTLLTWFPFDADAASASTFLTLGVAVNSAPAAAQPVSLQSEPGARVTIGGTLVAGTSYWASGTAGSIQDAAPDTADISVFVGVAATTAIITLALRNFAVAAP